LVAAAALCYGWLVTAAHAAGSSMPWEQPLQSILDSVQGPVAKIHVNVTAHPSADWTLQQLRMVVGDEGGNRYLIHDRDQIFAKALDDSIRALGVEVLRSPIAGPKVNAICERVIGTIRRECLDWMIPMSEAHLRSILKSWVEHYNQGRPHSRLGPGVPDPPPGTAVVP
jgi:putative transposase